MKCLKILQMSLKIFNKESLEINGILISRWSDQQNGMLSSCTDHGKYEKKRMVYILKPQNSVQLLFIDIENT